jgi:hypothetical protein
MYRPEGFTVGAGRSRLYGSSPQAKVAWEDLQMSLIRRRVSAGVSSCVECWVGSMGPLIWQILCDRCYRGETRRLMKHATRS